MTTRASSTRSVGLLQLVDIGIFELPYAVAGDRLSVGVTAGKMTGDEQGFIVFMSIDGSTYFGFARNQGFSPVGYLSTAYPEDTLQIDDDVGFTIEVAYDSFSSVNNIARAQLFGYDNLAILGNEIISFQYITPLESVGTAYKISGILRGRFDTKRQTHPVGTRMYVISRGRYATITNEYLCSGVKRYFKVIPFGRGGALSQDTAYARTARLTGRAFKPYPVANIKANDKYINPWYTNDIVLEWHPRHRTVGAGIGSPEVALDSTITYEGTFTVWAYVGTTLLRKTELIDALTLTYTEEQIVADYGSLPTAITFYVSNSMKVGNNVYNSENRTITVRRA